MPNLSYTTNIPLGTDNPQTSAGQFNVNFTSIGSIVNQDLYGFNDNNGGLHQQVTFGIANPQKAPPTPPVTPPQLFINFKDGAGNTLPGSLNELFFYSGDAAHSQNQYVSASSGSVLLLGGIIMKWGSLNPTTLSPPNTVTYASPFPNNIFSVVITVANFQYGTTTQNYRAVIPGSLNGFSFFFTGLTTANPINYIAIGN